MEKREKVMKMVAALRVGDMDVVEWANELGLDVIVWGDEIFHPMEHLWEVLVDLLEEDDIEKVVDAVSSTPSPCLVVGDWGLCGEAHARLVAWKTMGGE